MRYTSKLKNPTPKTAEETTASKATFGLEDMLDSFTCCTCYTCYTCHTCYTCNTCYTCYICFTCYTCYTCYTYYTCYIYIHVIYTHVIHVIQLYMLSSSSSTSSSSSCFSTKNVLVFLLTHSDEETSSHDQVNNILTSMFLIMTGWLINRGFPMQPVIFVERKGRHCMVNWKNNNPKQWIGVANIAVPHIVWDVFGTYRTYKVRRPP